MNKHPWLIMNVSVLHSAPIIGLPYAPGESHGPLPQIVFLSRSETFLRVYLSQTVYQCVAHSGLVFLGYGNVYTHTQLRRLQQRPAQFSAPSSTLQPTTSVEGENAKRSGSDCTRQSQKPLLVLEGGSMRFLIQSRR